jgi:hypothetical protein
MKIARDVLVFLMLLQSNLFAQVSSIHVDPPSISDFASVQQFLSSDWMEGRETGERGSFMAADYIVSMMQFLKLGPCVDNQKSFFQDFGLIRYKVEKSEITLIQNSPERNCKIQFSESMDYRLSPFPKSFETEAQIAFCGFGISEPKFGYDDYKNLDVKGKIVLVIEGYPGQEDSTSAGWTKLSKSFGDMDYLNEHKLQAAKKHGAIAIIEIRNGFKSEPLGFSNQYLLKSTMNSRKDIEPIYEDFEYILPSDYMDVPIPHVLLSKYAGQQLLNGFGIDIVEFKQRTSRSLLPSSLLLRDSRMKFSIGIKNESVLVRNILGVLKGSDSTKNIIVGAHYDHLGKRSADIYNGADDNASGVAGMLALAKSWSESGVKPPCNIVFAAWTGEEKGLLGSRYFTNSLNFNPKAVLLYINMDMISRSAPEDTAKRQLSIGTRIEDKPLREMANKINSSFNRPFELDLWDVTGHYGSDYASFRDKGIPVMSFFSGFHDEYHTTQDIAPKVEPKKMALILGLVNECLKRFLEDLQKKY